MTGEPPLEDGALHESCTESLPPAAVSDCGAVGAVAVTAVGVALASLDADDVPAELTAATV